MVLPSIEKVYLQWLYFVKSALDDTADFRLWRVDDPPRLQVVICGDTVFEGSESVEIELPSVARYR